jgi:hypothetical protein
MKNYFLPIIFIFFLIEIISCSGPAKKKSHSVYENIISNDDYFRKVDTSKIIYEFKFIPLKTDTLFIIITKPKGEFPDNESVVTRGYFKKSGYQPQIMDSSEIYGGYCGDTLIDANFDGIKDYTINFYSGCGCCPRDEKIIFIYDVDSSKFDEEVFLNSYFDQSEKRVYDMEYGWPTAITKSKWEGDSLVPLEWLGCNEDSAFAITNAITEKDSIVNDLPPTYKNVPMYDWMYQGIKNEFRLKLSKEI